MHIVCLCCLSKAEAEAGASWLHLGQHFVLLSPSCLGSPCLFQTGTCAWPDRTTGNQRAWTSDSILVTICGILVSCPSVSYFRNALCDGMWPEVVVDLWTAVHKTVPKPLRTGLWYVLEQAPVWPNEWHIYWVSTLCPAPASMKLRVYLRRPHLHTGPYRLGAKKNNWEVFEFSYLTLQMRKWHRTTKQRLDPGLLTFGPKLCHYVFIQLAMSALWPSIWGATR